MFRDASGDGFGYVFVVLISENRRMVSKARYAVHITIYTAQSPHYFLVLYWNMQ